MHQTQILNCTVWPYICLYKPDFFLISYQNKTSINMRARNKLDLVVDLNLNFCKNLSYVMLFGDLRKV